MTIRKITLATATVIGLALSSTYAPAMATPETGSTQEAATNQLAGNVNKLDGYEDISEESLNEILPVAQSAATDAAVLEAGQQIADHPLVAKRLENGNSFISTRIEGASEGSVIAVVLSPDNQVESTYQITLEETSPNSGWVTTYTDGKVERHQHVTAANPPKNEVSPLGMDWGGLNRCLSNAGIAAWAVAALSVVCGAACAATAGAGCIACLAAASGATGGTIGFCVGKNWS